MPVAISQAGSRLVRLGYADAFGYGSCRVSFKGVGVCVWTFRGVDMSGKPASEPDMQEPRRRKRAPSQPPAGPARFADTGNTIADAVYARLHRDIVSMNLKPGTAISEKEVALVEGVSRTPVREAILRLSKEKLVEVVPKSGTFVARIPLSSLPEAIIVRRALEAATVRAAARHATADHIRKIHLLIDLQRKYATAGDELAFHRADEDFHAEIANSVGYQGIWDLIAQVKVQVDRYRRLTLPQEGRMHIIIEEHCAVIDAIEAGNADAAVHAMEAHLDKLQLDLTVFRDMWPDYFIHDTSLG